MTYTRNQIDAILLASDEAVMKAIVRLFELQTMDEQAQADTKYDNDLGFSCTDAKAGTRFARWLLGMNDQNQVVFPPKSLSHPRAARIFYRYCKNGEQPIDRARRIALKHSRQITALANGEITVLTPQTGAVA
jgi:hypothetical protein